MIDYIEELLEELNEREDAGEEVEVARDYLNRVLEVALSEDRDWARAKDYTF